MELIMAQTCEWHRTKRYLYTTEVREYRIVRYRVRFSKRSYLCTAFDSYEKAADELARLGQGGWVESFEMSEDVILHHRYINREGR